MARGRIRTSEVSNPHFVVLRLHDATGQGSFVYLDTLALGPDEQLLSITSPLLKALVESQGIGP